MSQQIEHLGWQGPPPHHGYPAGPYGAPPPMGPPPRPPRRGMPAWGWVLFGVGVAVILALVAGVAVWTLVPRGTTEGTPTEHTDGTGDAVATYLPLTDLVSLSSRPDASLSGPWTPEGASNEDGTRVMRYGHQSLDCRAALTTNEGMDGDAGATSDEEPSTTPFEELFAMGSGTFVQQGEFGRRDQSAADGVTFEMVTSGYTNATSDGEEHNRAGLRAFAGSGHSITLSVKCSSPNDVDEAFDDLLEHATIVIDVR